MAAEMLNVGDIFGEDSLHAQTPYEYDVVAEGPVSLLVISRDSIEQLCGSTAEIVARTTGPASTTDAEKEISSMTEKVTVKGN